jgi:cytochrome c553
MRHLLPAALLAAVLPVAAQAPDPQLLKTCVECHGMNGVAGKPDVPHMDGQKNVYLADSLKAFADRSRATAVDQHSRIPAEQVVPLANHYAGQAITHPKGQADAALAAKGESIYNNRCADCHFDAGRDADKDAPLLAAQNLDYLIAQTLAFRRGVRKFPFMMDDAYRGLADDDLTAVAHFFFVQDPGPSPAAGKRRRKK